ncbi:MAG: hypothetical protein SF029_00045 [bacterium]|nr:hypothetical protein [bacterium]
MKNMLWWRWWLVVAIIITLSLLLLIGALWVGMRRADSTLAVLEVDPFAAQLHLLDIDRPAMTQSAFRTILPCDVRWTHEGGLLAALLLPHISTTEHQIYRLDVFAGGLEAPPVPLTGQGDHRAPAVTPDGERFAYVSTDDKQSTIFLQSLNSASPQQIAELPFQVDRLDWSVEGAYLVMELVGGGASLLEVAGARVWPLRPEADSFAWAAHRSLLAYVAEEALYVYNPLTGEERLLVRTGVKGDVTWSPSGARLAYVQRGEVDQIMLVKIEGEGEALPQMFETPTFRDIEALRWSPDGRRLTFAARMQTVDAQDRFLPFDLYAAGVFTGETWLVQRGMGQRIGVESRFCPPAWKP